MDRHITELLPEYIDGALTEDQAVEVKRHLQACDSCMKAYGEELKLEEEFSFVRPGQPGQKLKSAVFAMIEEEKKALGGTLLQHKQSRLVFLLSWQNMSRAAAAVLLVLGGYWLGGRGEMTAPEGNELTEMRQELGDIKEMLMLANLKAQHPSERLQAVSQVESYQSSYPNRIDPKLVGALVNTLNTDGSPNVRLAAANALQKFAISSDTVRAELVRSLEFQTEPIVQIALISMMVELEEKSAIGKLKQLVENDGTFPEVKKQAQLGIEVLI